MIARDMALTLLDLCLTRACSGWSRHSGGDSKILATADAQVVVLLTSVLLEVMLFKEQRSEGNNRK
jgi:hypothetical protein